MFEQALVYFLKKFLNLFIENPDDPSIIKEKIHIGVWSGLIILENLVLKNTLLSLIDIPLSLVHGYIGRLEVRIPWSNLGIDPVTIIIDKIYILMEPKYEWNPGAADKREQAMKQAKLVAAEIFAKRLNTNSSSQNSNQTYSDYAKNWLFASFINKVIDNIEITIREVHIRYEDQLSCPSNFCVGITLASLHVQSRDHEFNFTENYSPSPVKGNQNMNTTLFPTDMMDDSIHLDLKTKGFETFHKLIQVNHLSVYWNPLVATGLNICGCSFKGRQNKEIQLFMFRTIPTRIHQVTDRPRHHYILFPIDINTYLDMSFNTSTGIAKANVKVVISDLSITLEDLQLREIISIATNMGSFAKLQRFSEFRPATTIFEDPAAWWRYAINAVLLQLRLDRKKHMKLNIKQLSQRYKDKLVYVELWKSKLISSQYIVNQLSQVDHTVKPTINHMNSSLYQSILIRAKQIVHRKTTKQINVVKEPAMNRRGSKSSRGEKNISEPVVSVEQEVNTEKIENLQPLNSEMIELLHSLEYSLSFEDIVLFRSYAEKNLSIETTHQSWIGGIMSWISTGVTGSKSNQIAEEEKRKLFEALKYDPERILRGGTKEINQNEVMTVIGVYMAKGSITLALTSPDIHSVFQGSIPFLTLELEDLRNRTVLMGDGSHLKVNLSLQDFTAYEILPSSTALNLTGTTHKTRNKILFRRILKGIDSKDHFSESSLSTDTHKQQLHSTSLINKQAYLPLFSTMIEMLPSNKDSDMLVQLQVEELEVWISPSAIWTSSMGTFVAWPSDLQYWSEMEMQSMNQLADFKARFDAKLEYMMNNHSNIIIEANINAPVVVISDRASHEEKGDVLVIDLGLISLTTEKLAKAQRQKVLDSKSHTGFTSDATSVTPIYGAENIHRVRDNHSPLNNDVAVTLQFSSHKLTPVKELSMNSIDMKSISNVIVADEMDDDAIPEENQSLVIEKQQQQQSIDWDILSENKDHELIEDAIDSKNQSVKLFTNSKSVSKKNVLSTFNATDQSIEGSNNASHSRDDADSSNYASSYDGEMNGNKAPSVGGISTVNTEGLECKDGEEENLYDVFQCQISQIQVYLISYTVIKDGNMSAIDNTKTIIVNKFEVGVEIQVSVLPWDTSLPPVKLMLDIPEVNVKLSLQKLLRLKQFSIELATDNSTTSMITSNLVKINNINKLLKKKSKSKDVDISRNTAHSRSQKLSIPMNPRLSFMSNSSIISLKRSKKRRTMSLNHSNDGVSTTSEPNETQFHDTITGRLSSSFQTNKNNSFLSPSNNLSANNSLRNGKVIPKDAPRRRSFSNTSGLLEGIGGEDRLKKLIEKSYVVRSEDGTNADYENRFNGIDNDDNDDDSFFSMEDQFDVEEHTKQKEHLQYVIAQRENMRTKLMTDIRVTEADVTKAGLHETLKNELAMCEQELQQLRVAYVELLMSTEDLHRYNIENTPDPTKLKDFTEELQLGMGPLTGNIVDANLGHKRDLAQASVFKIPSLQVQQQRREQINKELVFMKMNVLIVNVDLECVSTETKLINRIISKPTASDKTSRRNHRKNKKSNNIDENVNEVPTITCRLTLTSINFKLRHRVQDSRIGFSLQELDVSDIIEYKSKSSSSTNKAVNKIFLLSSEPTNFGLFVLPMVSNRFNSNGGSDLVKIKYEVFYGNETNKSNDDTEDFDFISEATHNIKVTMGLLGISIEQNRIALLIHTIHQIMTSSSISTPAFEPIQSIPVNKSDLKIPESKVDNNKSQVSQRGSMFPNIIFGSKIDCICVSMMQSCVPLSNVTLWALTSTLQCRSQSIAISCRLADLSVHYLKSQNSQRTTDRVLICGRDTTSPLPFVSLSLHYDKDTNDIMSVPHVSITTKTVPIVISADLDFAHEIMKEITTGPIAEAITVLSPVVINEVKQDQQQVEGDKQSKVIGNTLNMILNPLLDSCNGQLEVVLGSISISSGGNGDGVIQRSQNMNSNKASSKQLSNKVAYVIFAMKSIEAHMIWGDICEFGAVQLSLVLQEISLTCNNNENNYIVMNPFDLFCKFHTMPSMYFHLPNNSDQADYVANLTFNSIYLPPSQSEIKRNEVQIAVSLSPILLHIHENILQCLLAWSKIIEPQINKLISLTIKEPENVSESSIEIMNVRSVTTTIEDHHPSHEIDSITDFDLNFILLAYEVVLSIESSTILENNLQQQQQQQPQKPLDSYISPTLSRSFSSGKLQNIKNLPRNITSPKLKGNNSLQNIDFQPIFRLILTHINTQLSLKVPNTLIYDSSSPIKISNNNVTSDSDYLLSLEPFILLHLNANIESLHLEYIKIQSTVSYKRLITTGIGINNKYTTTPTVDSNTLYSTENLSSVDKEIFPEQQRNFESKETLTSSNLDFTEDCFTTNFQNYQSLNTNEKAHFIPSVVKFISLEVLFDSSSDVHMNLNINNMHVTYITDAILTMISLTDAYQKCIEDCSSSSKNIPQTTLDFNPSIGSIKNENKLKPQSGYSSFAHPSSVPMAPILNSTIIEGSANIRSESNVSKELLPTTLLCKNSLDFTNLINQIKCKVNLSNNYIYLPTEKQHGKGPALCISLSHITIDCNTCPIDNNVWIQITQDINIHQNIFQIKCSIDSLEIYLIQNIPIEISNPIVSLRISNLFGHYKDDLDNRIIDSNGNTERPVFSNNVSINSLGTTTGVGINSNSKESSMKMLLFPLHIEFVYSFSFSYNQTNYQQAVITKPQSSIPLPSNLSSIPQNIHPISIRFQENNKLLLFQQEIFTNIETCEIQVFLDYSPFIRLYENSIQPVLDKITAITQSLNHKSSVDSKDYSNIQTTSLLNHDRDTMEQNKKKKTIEIITEINNKPYIKVKNPKQLLQIRDLFELLPVLNDISTTTAHVKVKSIIVYIINDIYKQPISIARLNCTDLELNLSLNGPSRDFLVLVASKVIPPVFDDRTNYELNPDRMIDTSPSSNENKNITSHESTNKLHGTFLSSFMKKDNIQNTSIGIKSTISDNPSCILNIDFKAMIGVEYYNQRLIAREPLVEPFPLVLKFIHRSTSRNSEIIKNGPVIMLLNSNVHEYQSSNEKFASFLSDYIASLNTSSSNMNVKVDIKHDHQNNLFSPNELNIEIPRPIIINLTMALFEIAVVTFRVVNNSNVNNDKLINTNHVESNSYSNKNNHHGSTTTNQDISILGIRNDSGLLLRYWTKEGKGTEEVAPNTEAPLQLEYFYDNMNNSSRSHLHQPTTTTTSASSASVYKGIDGRFSTARVISVALHDAENNSWSAIHDIPLEGLGTRLFYMDFHAKNKISNTESTEEEKISIQGQGQSRGYEESKRSNKLKFNNELPYSSNTNKMKEHSGIPSIALELVSKGGNKVLIIRSTMRLFNATKITYKIELISGFRNNKRNILWEALLPPNQGVPVPANLCDVPNGRFIIKPILNFIAGEFNCEGSFWPKIQINENNPRIPFAAEIPFPDIPGLSKRTSVSKHLNSQGTKFDDVKTIESRLTSNDGVEDDINSIESYSDKNTLISEQMDENDQLPANLLPSNFVCWRKKLLQQRGALNTQSYSHWLSLSRTNLLDATTGYDVELSRQIEYKDLCTELSNMKEVLYCNVNVCSKGALQTQAQARSPECCMLRTITFSPPITVVNLTAGELSIAITSNLMKHGQSNDLECLLKLDNNIQELIPQIELAPGESWDFFSSHAYMDISCSFKISSTGYTSSSAPSSVSKKWSKAVLIPGCRSKTNDTTVYNCEIEYQNGSVLSLQVEVMDRNGCRVISVYVPYWIMSTSFLSLQYQHDTWLSSNYSDHVLNGIDGLAADQSFLPVNESKSSDQDDSDVQFLEDGNINRKGLGKARGMNGILLGPDIPIRGLVDIFNPVSTGSNSLHDRHSLKEMLEIRKSLPNELKPFLINSENNYSSNLMNINDNAVASLQTQSFVNNNPNQYGSIGSYLNNKNLNSFHLVQCGYSFRDKKGSRIRFRTSKSSQWSAYLALDHEGISTMNITSASRNESASEDIDITRAIPHMMNARNSNSGGTRIFSFGVMIKAAEPPFNRTQIVMIVDRFHLNNTMNHNIEVRQIGQNAIFNVRNQDIIPMWWRNGPQHLQMRLARYGWSWSGKFSIQAEGEISIRLRNDFDNTVFFVLVQVILQGPSMYIVFKGGEKFSPYRFENHTLDTFKIKQKGQINCTNLLPYHCCAYAWDEPLLPHSFTIDMLKNPLQSQDDWGMIGTFSFDCLGILSHSAGKNYYMNKEMNKKAKKNTSNTKANNLSSATNTVVQTFSHLILRVVAQGPTRVLQIFDRRILNSLDNISISSKFKNYENLLTNDISSNALDKKENKSEILFGITLNINSLGISFVDQIPQELIFIAISNVKVKHMILPQQSISNIDISRIQIDNQLWSTPYPSMLYPLLPLQEIINEDILNKQEAISFISFELHRDMKYIGVEYLPLLKLSISPFDVNIDGSIVSRLVDTVNYILELSETVHNTNSHAYSYQVSAISSTSEQQQHHVEEANDSSVLPNILQPPSSAKSNSKKDQQSLMQEQHLTKHYSDKPQIVCLSYYDAAEFVLHSPYACASPGTILRPSQLDNIHTMMYSLSNQKKQYLDKLKEQSVLFPLMKFKSISSDAMKTSNASTTAFTLPRKNNGSKSALTNVTSVDESDSQIDFHLGPQIHTITSNAEKSFKAFNYNSKMKPKEIESNQYYLSNINRINLAHIYMNKVLDKISLPLDSLKPTAKLYIEHLEISEIRLNASFNPIVNNEIRSSNTTTANKTLLQSAVNALMLAIGSAIAKIDNCPISFRAFKVDHVFNSANNITNMLITNYTMQAISQAYLVLFSSEILGNPVRIIKAISEGLWDFLYLPTLGLFVSPKAFAIGAIRGTSSLFCNLLASIFTTGGSLASSLQVGMETLGVIDPYLLPINPTNIVHSSSSLSTPSSPSTVPINHLAISNNPTTILSDDGINSNNTTMKSKYSSNQSVVESDDGQLSENNHPQQNSHHHNHQSRNLIHSIDQSNIQLLRPNTLLKGLHLGISRFFLDPLIGFRSDGVKGLVIGILKGSFGLFARPIYGALGFTAQSLNRISFKLVPRFLANQKLRLLRSRPPRFFRSPNLPIKIYSLDENIGQELLSRIQGGDFRHEGYLWHGILKDKSIILLTKVRIVIYSEGFDTCQLLWNSLISSLISLDVEYNQSHISSEIIPNSQDFSILPSTSSMSRMDNKSKKLLSKTQNNLTEDSIQENTSGNILSNIKRNPIITTQIQSVQKQLFNLLGHNCQLVGSPVLHIYHVPMNSNHNTSKSTKSNQKEPIKNNISSNKQTNNSLRLSHKIILFESHLQLLEFFSALLPIHKNLLSLELIKYLTDANVNLEEAKKILKLNHIVKVK